MSNNNSSDRAYKLPPTAIVPTLIVGSPEDHYKEQLEQIKVALSEAATVRELVELKQRALALEEVTRQLRRDYNLDNTFLLDIAEVRLRVQRRLGQIIVKNGTKFSNNDGFNLGKNERSLIRRLGSVSDEKFKTVIDTLKGEIQSAPNSNYRLLSLHRVTRTLQVQHNGNSSLRGSSSVIKTSDNWNFSSLRYPRIDAEGNDWGYIPGDLYANCLWYYAHHKDIVVAPMAGMGQIQRVYDDRDNWLGDRKLQLNLHLFDLTPRGPYKNQIQANDLTQKIPLKCANYIVLDIPYFGMSEQQYSTDSRDVANLCNYNEWLSALGKIACNCAAIQTEGDRCTVITPNYRNVKTREIILVTDDIRRLWLNAGYRLYDKVYSSRRIQQTQSFKMANLNNLARKSQIALTDISEVLTFMR